MTHAKARKARAKCSKDKKSKARKICRKGGPHAISTFWMTATNLSFGMPKDSQDPDLVFKDA